MRLKPGGTEGREKSAGQSMASRGNRICKDVGALLPGSLSPVLSEQRGSQDNGGVAVPNRGQAWGVPGGTLKVWPHALLGTQP